MIRRTLYFGNPAYLSLNLRQLVIRKPEVKGDMPNFDETGVLKDVVKTIPIEDIGLVVLDCPQIVVTQGALAALLENNCAVITCDKSHLPTGLLLSLYGNKLQAERYTCQVEASLPLKKQLWQQTIQSKIRNQAAVLKYATGEDPKNMILWVNAVRSGDPDNVEGRAAAYYWKTVFLGNPYFTRGGDDVVNIMLNYGYAIVRAVVARALAGAGLIPTLGIHHHNRYDAYCLADDVMEPYRPYVDKLVVDIVNEENPEKFDLSVKRKLLEIPVVEVVIDGVRRPLMLAVSQTVNSLQKCFAGTMRKLSYPDMYG